MQKMAKQHRCCSVSLLITICFVGFLSFPADAAVKKYRFDIQLKNVSRLCQPKKPIVTVNKKFPGPTIYATEGDRLLVDVINHVQYNISIHWHGLKQHRNGWADGPAYVTQCPIMTGNSYTYDFNITGQRGTLWWHAHISWLRATVYGVIVIMPKEGIPYPFPKPYQEKYIVLGEWWIGDVETIVSQAAKLGIPQETSDALTINGKPGPVPSCLKDAFSMEIESGKMYLLRIVNAALNDELFFTIAGHNMTVVEIDAVYTTPFTTQTILISPGQTTNVLITADQSPSRYFMAARLFSDSPVPVGDKIVKGIVQYKDSPDTDLPILSTLPVRDDTNLALSYTGKLRSLNTPEYPANVPLQVDHQLFYTISIGKNPCPTCINGTKFTASLNNITFVIPKIGLLEAHYFKVSGVFSSDLPDRPLVPYNYTGASLTGNIATALGTRLTKLAFNSSVEVVLQGTNLLIVQSHPFHLHGHNFFVVGSGIGNFDPEKDPAKYNLIDPPERNTVEVPTGGWSAIRFRADNPGVWFMHCHLEIHQTWGMEMALVVENGESPEESILPPPKDLPPC